MIPLDVNDEDNNKGVDFESIDENILRGDAIGNTTYSERFVLSTLMQMIRVEEMDAESPLEENLCTLWDMTVEKDIVIYLLRREVLSSICLALPLTNNNRIIEILLGIVGNMCCEAETRREFNEKPVYLEAFVEYIHSDDSYILIQVLRLVNIGLYKDSNKQKWLEALFETEFPRALTRILVTNINKDVLLNAFEMFNTVCAMCYEDDYKALFMRMFSTPNTMNGYIAAFHTLEREQLGNGQIQRFHSIFININIVLIDLDPDEYCEMILSKERLVACLYNIIKQNVADLEFDFNENMIDVYEGVTQVLSAIGMPQTKVSTKLFKNYLKTWLFIEKAIEERSNVNDPVAEAEIQVYNALKSSLAQYLVRYLKVTPMNILKKAIINKEETIGSILRTIKAMSEEGTISKNVIRDNLYTIIEELKLVP